MDKTCFVIAPIGNEDSATRRRTDGIIKAMRPIVEQYYSKIIAAHELPDPGSISKQVIEHLIHSPLVIADLTNLNPNVMYELAVRHATNKPIIAIASDGTPLPFDIKDERTVFYTNDIAGTSDFTNKISKCIEIIQDNYTPNNPISRVIQHDIIQRNIKSDFESYLMDKLDRLESIVVNTKQNQNHILNSTRLRRYMVRFKSTHPNNEDTQKACDLFLEDLKGICYISEVKTFLENDYVAFEILAPNLPKLNIMKEMAENQGLLGYNK